MSRHLSVATVIDKNRLKSEAAYIVLLQIHVINPINLNLEEILYVCANDENLTYQEQLYTATNFTFSMKVERGSMPEMTLEYRDFSRDLQARMQAYGGGVGFKVVLICVNTSNLEQPPEMEEVFTVLDASAKNYLVSFTLGAANPLSRRFPFGVQYRDRCSWTYRGNECGYAGSLATCDYTLQGPNGCAAHGNTEKFGGFPGIKVVS